MISKVDIDDYKDCGYSQPEPVITKVQDFKQGKWVESDPTGRSAKEPGSKLDAGKSPIFQGLLDYFPRACLAVAGVSAAGAAKYAWKGWETVPDGINRYNNALARHIINESIEGPMDPEGFLHKAQIAWNAMAALELFLKEKK